MKKIEITSYKLMRVLVLFDLPVETKHEIRQYTHFRKFLLDDGFIMIQYSIYMRFCRNTVDADKHIARIRQLSPQKGNIRILCVTEKQYENMILIIGEKSPTELMVNEQMTMVIE